jgi:hypothetical protein
VLAPGGAGTVVGYTYTVNNGPSITVPAGSDATATITVDVTDGRIGDYLLAVAANLAGGTHTSAGNNFLVVDPAAPTVGQTPDNPAVGQPVQFTFGPGLPGVVSYTYVWDDGDDVTVPAGADGTASVTLTSDNEFVELDVFSTTADGIISGVTTEFVFVQ